MAKYLVNANSPEAAGWYDDETAAVILASAQDRAWSESEPPPAPEPPAAPAAEAATGDSAAPEGN